MTFQAVLHLLLSLGYVAAIGWFVARIRSATPAERPDPVASGIVLAIAPALFYDNFILAIGAWVGEGGLLEGLSLPRFILHAVLTPTMIVAARRIAAASGSPWATRPLAVLGSRVLVVIIVVASVLTEIVGLNLEFTAVAGIDRYTAPDAMIPIGSILAVLVMMAAGAVLRRRTGDVRLLAGSAAMFALAGAGASQDGLLLGNVGEFVLISSLVEVLALTLAGDSVTPAAAAPVDQSESELV